MLNAAVKVLLLTACLNDPLYKELCFLSLETTFLHLSCISLVCELLSMIII